MYKLIRLFPLAESAEYPHVVLQVQVIERTPLSDNTSNPSSSRLQRVQIGLRNAPTDQRGQCSGFSVMSADEKGHQTHFTGILEIHDIHIALVERAGILYRTDGDMHTRSPCIYMGPRARNPFSRLRCV